MEEIISNQNNNISLLNIKSKVILKKIIDNLPHKKFLNIIKYNKAIQKRINKDLNDYKNEYYKIIIEIIPVEYSKGKIINVGKKYESYYHIYFNDIKKEKRKKITKENKTEKITLIIDYEIKTLSKLFIDRIYIKKINFIKFNRQDITDISYMFSGCTSLEEINLSKINTNNVIYMNGLFSRCKSLKQLDISNLNTEKVIHMDQMFSGCKSLKKLNLSNFNTVNVSNMSFMFNGCSFLDELNLSNFNTNNVTNMSNMFKGCFYLKRIISTDNKILNESKKSKY